MDLVIGLFDRKVIGWSFSIDMDREHTTVAALTMAFKNRTAQEGLLFHSHRGVQYCAKAFRDTLRERSPTARQSMSRKGNCWSNACAESFFKTLKQEQEALDGKHTEVKVRQSVSRKDLTTDHTDPRSDTLSPVCVVRGFFFISYMLEFADLVIVLQKARIIYLEVIFGFQHFLDTRARGTASKTGGKGDVIDKTSDGNGRRFIVI